MTIGLDLRYPKMCPKSFPCKFRIQIIPKKMELLDPMVQNPIFGFLRSSLVNFYAYVEESIMNYA